jgi:hypothetical protein
VNEDPQHVGREQRRQQLGEKLKKLQDIHQASEGRKILARTYAFEDSYYVFLVSQGELKAFLDHIAANAVSVHMWDMRHRYRLDYAQREVVRLLHNYVAAAFFLVDATRVFVNEHYEDTALFREYNDRVKRDFREAPLHRFLQDLRNYPPREQTSALGGAKTANSTSITASGSTWTSCGSGTSGRLKRASILRL